MNYTTGSVSSRNPRPLLHESFKLLTDQALQLSIWTMAAMVWLKEVNAAKNKPWVEWH